jgi:hypothetical protein
MSMSAKCFFLTFVLLEFILLLNVLYRLIRLKSVYIGI